MSSLLIALLAAVALLPNRASADDPDVVSPLVSYQFLDSLADTPDQPNVVSPLVSYQYFDWLGDETVTFETSPTVSYYFGGGTALTLSGIVADASGTPVSGVEVILQRYNTPFWHGYTGSDGSIPAGTLPSGNFNVVVNKAGYTSLFQSVAGDSGGSVFLNLTLHQPGTPPSLTTVVRAPAETAIRQEDPPPVQGVRAANLRVFNNGSFSTAGTLRSDRMTIVICHGLWSNLDSWATEMASALLQMHSLGGETPNIVGWDWRVAASSPIDILGKAANQGENLGKSLYQELGAGYAKRIHVIGHSAGTVVNSYACDFLHGELPRQTSVFWNKAETKPHVTLLDEAELANVFGSNVSTSGAGAWFDAQSRSQLFDIVNGTATASSGYKNPFPRSAAWMDNYISLVGLHNSRAVNVYLPAGVDTLWGAHADSHQWYRQSIQNVSSQHAMGFARSYERALVFPPSGTGMSAGSVWTWPLLPADPFDLEWVQNPALFNAAGSVMRAGSIVVSSAGGSVVDGYVTGLKLADNLIDATIQKTGQVIISTTEKVGSLWDAALDYGSTINPDTLFTGSIAAPSLRLIFSTPAQSAPSSFAMRKMNSESSAQDPQAWVPVRIPEDAAFLVFDFYVTGDPADDQIVCAINEQNLFTLPARFAPDGSPVSTDFLDVSAYAGQEVELYFGLVGGTSSGCTLAIDGLRFVTVPTPKLAAEVVGNQVFLKWPAAASGWVPQRNASLDPQTWEDISLDGATISDGITVASRLRNGTREFFRLRRLE